MAQGVNTATTITTVSVLRSTDSHTTAATWYMNILHRARWAWVACVSVLTVSARMTAPGFTAHHDAKAGGGGTAEAKDQPAHPPAPADLLITPADVAKLDPDDEALVIVGTTGTKVNDCHAPSEVLTVYCCVYCIYSEIRVPMPSSGDDGNCRSRILRTRVGYGRRVSKSVVSATAALWCR